MQTSGFYLPAILELAFLFLDILGMAHKGD